MTAHVASRAPELGRGEIGDASRGHRVQPAADLGGAADDGNVGGRFDPAFSEADYRRIAKASNASMPAPDLSKPSDGRLRAQRSFRSSGRRIGRPSCGP